jgi:hypothetical protein
MVPVADAAVAMIDPEDVGSVGAHLLALEDTTSYSNAKSVLSGLDDVTGNELVKLVEHFANAKVEKAVFKDIGFLDGLTKSDLYPEKFLPSFLAGCEPLWQGRLIGTPISK